MLPYILQCLSLSAVAIAILLNDRQLDVGGGGVWALQNSGEGAGMGFPASGHWSDMSVTHVLAW